MPVVVAEDSAVAEHIKYRKPRNPNTETDPNSFRSKPTISSILLSNDTTNDATATKKKNFTSSTFRGLGCTASSHVSVPAAIRTSANWEPKKVKKRRLKTKKSSGSNLFCNSSSAAAAVTNNGTNNANPLSQSSLSLALSSSCVSVPDVWCGPGIGLTTDAASVDCVVSRRPPPVSARSKVDGVDRIILGQRERSSVTVRRMVSSEDIPFIEPDMAIGMPRFRADTSRHHRNVRHGLREGLAEIVMLQSSLLMGGRTDGLDRYRDLRLDVDNMSYEELLELGDRIGYVNTGLREDEITNCLRSNKLATLENLTSYFPTEMERKCSICQEEYEMDDETGKLNCGHSFHIDCIKQWLLQKKICPICKTAAVSHI